MHVREMADERQVFLEAADHRLGQLLRVASAVGAERHSVLHAVLVVGHGALDSPVLMSAITSDTQVPCRRLARRQDFGRLLDEHVVVRSSHVEHALVQNRLVAPT